MTIYFIGEVGADHLKIGYTAADPKRRMAQLQTGHAGTLFLIGTIPGEKDGEFGLHRHFSSHKMRGEWFRRDDHLIETITYLIDKQLPWYFCREAEFSQRFIESEWRLAFGSGPDHIGTLSYPTIDGPSLRFAIKRALALRDREDEFKANFRKKGDDKAWRKRLYEWAMEFKNTTEHRMAFSAIAWERGARMPPTS